MAGRLVMDMRTYEPLEDWETGRQLLSPLFAQPKLRPDKVALMGEVTARHGIEVTGLEDCRPLWAMGATLSTGSLGHNFRAPFHWRCKGRAASSGQVSFPAIDGRGRPVAGGLAFQGRFQPEIDWFALFAEWCEVLSPFAAMLHPAIHLERSRAKAPVTTLAEEVSAAAEMQFQAGTPWCTLRAGPLNSTFSGLTNLGWANHLGGHLAPEVDEPAIRRAGFDVDRQGDGWLIRVTQKFTDVAADFASFEEQRRALRSCFRVGLFLVAD